MPEVALTGTLLGVSDQHSPPVTPRARSTVRAADLEPRIEASLGSHFRGFHYIPNSSKITVVKQQ